MKIDEQSILDEWKLYTLTNKQGMKVSFLNFGGIITRMLVPNKDGIMENVVLSYKNYEDYKENPNFFGALVGRVAGRVQDASFTIHDETYHLEANEGVHHLHGGSKGLNQVIWGTSPFQTDDAVGVTLTHTSVDGTGGYPGTVNMTVTYSLNNNNEFTIDYAATSDKDTALTLTNHSYFNLSGNLADTVHEHYVSMDSSQFVELDEALIPTGKIRDVAGTTFDFQSGKKIADGIHSTDTQNIIATNGYDHYFIFDHKRQESLVVKHDNSGRIMKMKTNQPGMVMYSGNALTNDLELTEGMSKPYLGVCFETQASPASLHHEGFPSVLLRANEKYEKQTTFTFSADSQ